MHCSETRNNFYTGVRSSVRGAAPEDRTQGVVTVCDNAAKRSSTFVTVVFVVLAVTLVVVFVMVIEGCKCTDA